MCCSFFKGIIFIFELMLRICTHPVFDKYLMLTFEGE